MYSDIQDPEPTPPNNIHDALHEPRTHHTDQHTSLNVCSEEIRPQQYIVQNENTTPHATTISGLTQNEDNPNNDHQDRNPVDSTEPRLIVPSNLQQSKDILKTGMLDNNTCKAVLKCLKISGSSNAKVSTKLKIIAVKMVQRQFSVKIALELVEKMTDYEMHLTLQAERLEKLPQTVVKITKSVNGLEEITWQRGDIPVFNATGDVVVGEPNISNGEMTGLHVTAREPDFEASEVCRLLHVLADTRMTNARRMLMETKSREELDSEPVDPWTESIAPLFNDITFQPEKISTVAGGVTHADIQSLQPELHPYKRNGGVLKRKFAEFKSLYGTCLAKYEASGQGDPEAFVFYADGKSYNMYAHCLLKKIPLLSPLATRALEYDVQREEGAGNDITPRKTSSKKRKRERQDINIVGMESLTSAFKPCSEDVARETEEAERDKAKYEASEAKGRSAQSLLKAIADAKRMQHDTENESEKAIYCKLVEQLMLDLSNSTS